MTLIAGPSRNAIAGTQLENASPGDDNDALSPAQPLNIPVPSVEVTLSVDQRSMRRSTRTSTSSAQITPLNNLSDVNTAINRVEHGFDDQQAVVDVDDGNRLQAAPLPARRRRASSRVNGKAHEVAEEEPPSDAFNTADFQSALRRSKLAMKELRAVLASGPVQQDADSVMKRLQNKAAELTDYEHHITRTVGFVGDSGVGKSSLLNSLLDIQHLARTDNGGSACTCVVTEYHYHDSDSITVETDLFTRSELIEQLSDMLRSYRQVNFNLNQIDESERGDCQERAQLAEDTFRCMFRSRIGSLEFLGTESETSILEKFKQWISELQPAESSVSRSGLSPDQCTALLMRLSSETVDSAQLPAIWPYVRKIRVFLNAHILSKGLILADLPGLRDMNAARRNNTELFLRECDEIFVICNIGRAITDQGVESVFKLAKQANLCNVGIICTKSDDIKADEARNNWTGAVAERIKKFQHTVAINQQYCDTAEQDTEELGDYEDEEGRLEFEAAAKSYHQAKKVLNQHKFELREYLIKSRNDVVTRSLRDQYDSSASGNSISIHCVGNELYWEKRKEPKQVSYPYLDLSGIMKVRQHCISIVSASQYQSALKYMKNDIPAFVSEVTLWVELGNGSMDAERKELVRNACDEVEEQLLTQLDGRQSLAKRISKLLKEGFKEEIYDQQQLSEWNAAARNAAQDWQSWHHSSYIAFSSRFGCHSTRTVGHRDWNEEIIETMVNDLTGPWEQVEAVVNTTQEDIESLVRNVVDECIGYLEEELGVGMREVAALKNVLSNQQYTLIDEINEFYEEFDSELASLRTDLLSGIRTSFVGQALEEPYKKCQWTNGTGSHARRKDIMNTAIQAPDLFKRMVRTTKSEFGQIADSLQQGIDSSMASYLEEVDSTLNLIRGDNVITDSERDPAFRGRVDDGVKAANEDMTGIFGLIG